MATCNKISYTTAYAARQALLHQPADSGQATRVSYYPCHTCQRWHLSAQDRGGGSQDRPGRRPSGEPPSVRCTKVGFPDQASARAQLADWRKRAKHGDRIPTRVYPCDVCDGWHLTRKYSGRKVPPWDKDPNWVRPTDPQSAN